MADRSERDTRKWLEGLADESSPTKDVVRKAGDILRAQQAAAEEEFDDIRLARSRKRLESALREVAPNTDRRWVVGLAAVFLFALAVGLFIQAPDMPEELISSYGSLERPRGLLEANTIELPQKNVDSILLRLKDLEAPFILYRVANDRLRLELTLPHALDERDWPKDDVMSVLTLQQPGYYAFDIEVSSSKR